MNKRFLAAKRLCISFFFMAFLLLSCIPAQSAAGLSYITDAANLLSDWEISQLETMAAEVADKYQFGVYIVTVNDYREYNPIGVEDCAESIYLDYDLGIGAQHDGQLLLLSMNERDYALFAFGYGNEAFTDYGKERLADEFIDDFHYDNWYDGFRDYINTSAEFVQRAQEGNNGNYSADTDILTDILLALILVLPLPCLIAGVVCFILKGKMKSVKYAASAETYVIRNKVKLNFSKDIFSHVTERREQIESNSRSGGGTTIHESGGSSSSGKF